MTVLLAADLDRTLIYSRAAAGPGGTGLVPVERYQGADASWLTVRAAGGLRALPAAGGILVPATTRTPAQWRRIGLPGPAPRFVVTANGGVLLVDGVADRSWDRTVAAAVAPAAPLAEVRTRLGGVCGEDRTLALREAADLFCYAVIDRQAMPARTLDRAVAEFAAWSAARGWRTSLQGRKLYCVPSSLTKWAAVAEVARRLDASAVLAAGDSLLDADLLRGADRAIAARHGELVASGWGAPHVEVTTATGVQAGEEIVDWFLAGLAALPLPSSGVPSSGVPSG